MINIKDKLIVSIANENYKNIINFAKKYKKIELRLKELQLSNAAIINVINIAEIVVITGISELSAINSFHKICFGDNHFAKIYIDCPVGKIENNNLIKYITNPNIKKILSYHQCPNNEKIVNIFPYLLEKIGSNISKYDIIKIAVIVENIVEEEQLFSFFTKYSSYNFILIPLGKQFRMSRIKSLKLGSKYMFCYVNNPITNCQLHYNEYL